MPPPPLGKTFLILPSFFLSPSPLPVGLPLTWPCVGVKHVLELGIEFVLELRPSFLLTRGEVS